MTKPLLLALLALSVGATACSRGEAMMTTDVDRLDFGSVPINVQQRRSLVLHNKGTASLEVTALEATPPFQVHLRAPQRIAPGEQLRIEVTYLAGAAAQNTTGEVLIVGNDRLRPRLVIPLSAEPRESLLVIEPAELDFGDVIPGESRTRALTVQNAADRDLQLRAVELLPETPLAPAVAAQLSPLRERIRPGSSVTIDITFTPNHSIEKLAGGLRLVLDSELGGARVIPFRGTVVRPRFCQRNGGCSPSGDELLRGYHAGQLPHFKASPVRFALARDGARLLHGTGRARIEVFGARAELPSGESAVGSTYIAELKPLVGASAWVFFLDGTMVEDHLDLIVTEHVQRCGPVVGYAPEVDAVRMLHAHFVLRDTPLNRASQIARVIVSKLAPKTRGHDAGEPIDQTVQAWIEKLRGFEHGDCRYASTD